MVLEDLRQRVSLEVLRDLEGVLSHLRVEFE